ncbi:sporulation protein [bacterium]|nr:sporulation protein [bacterium]
MEDQKSVLDSFLPQLKSFIKSETVFGEPFNIGNVTLIPVNSVKVGFGFGAGDNKNKVEGSGGGGGVLLTPVAFVVVKDDDVSIHSLSAGTIENVIDKAPEALDKIISVFQKIRNKKQKMDE